MAKEKKKSNKSVRLSEIIKKDNFHFINSTTVSDVISDLLGYINSIKTTVDFDSIFEKLMRRENLMSTGLGQGVALPHVGLKHMENIFIETGILKEEADWNSFDKKPVRIVILILFSQKNRVDYLRIIGKLSGILKDKNTRKAILECNNEQDLMDFLVKE